MRFSISIPQLDLDGFDDAGVQDYLERAEELGFEGGWTMESGGSPGIAPLPMLAYAAACTTRLRLGVAVLITSLHDPASARVDDHRGRPAQPRAVGRRRRPWRQAQTVFGVRRR